MNRRTGGDDIRVCGLIGNFGANAVALYGAARYFRDGTHLALLFLRLAATAVAILALGRPSR